jgi:hypothetical protein
VFKRTFSASIPVLEIDITLNKLMITGLQN